MVIPFIRRLIGLDQGYVSKTLSCTKNVRVNGIKFVIKKLDPFDYLAGFKTMHSLFDVYQRQSPESTDLSAAGDKIRKHYSDVLMSSVVHPKLTMKSDGEGLFVGLLLKNMEICEFLYYEIIEFTYGKKKLRQLGYRRRNF